MHIPFSNVSEIDIIVFIIIVFIICIYLLLEDLGDTRPSF